MALEKVTLQYPPKDAQLYRQFQHIKEKFNAVVDWANNLNVGSSNSLVKVGAGGTPDYLSADHFERTIPKHIKLKGRVVRHGSLSHLTIDDHPQYLLTSGGRELSGNWDAGGYWIRATCFTSDITTGTSPLTVTSTTLCTNLNADKVDGADLINEDNMVSDSDVHVPTQGSVKAYVDTAVSGASLYSFKTITGITNDVVADATDDTLTLASANNRLTIVGTTATDTIDFTLVEANIDHDALSNFLSTEHFTVGSIDHSAISNISYATAGHTGFEPTVTKGNLTETTSSVLTITGGTGAVIGSGLTIAVTAASTGVSGYLTGTDWDTFNSKEPGDATIVKDADFGSAGLCATNGSGTYSIVTDASANWNTAHGWGDHASGGYAAASHAMSTHSDEDTYNLNTSGTGQFGGNLGIGSAPLSGGIGIYVMKEGVGSGLYFDVYSSGSAWHRPLIALRRARDTVASPDAVVAADLIGGVETYAYDGSGFINTANIRFIMQANPTDVGDIVPAYISFTTCDVVGAHAERVRITADGYVMLLSIRSGATQVASGAAANELWKTNGHAHLEDNVVMIGV